MKSRSWRPRRWRLHPVIMSEQQVERWDGYQILPELVKALRSASTRGPERRAKLTAPEAKAGSFRPCKFREETILGAAGNF